MLKHTVDLGSLDISREVFLQVNAVYFSVINTAFQAEARICGYAFVRGSEGDTIPEKLLERISYSVSKARITYLWPKIKEESLLISMEEFDEGYDRKLLDCVISSLSKLGLCIKKSISEEEFQDRMADLTSTNCLLELKKSVSEKKSSLLQLV